MKQHQPFEAWIFEEHLSLDEQQKLADHLSQCDSCRDLHSKWNETEIALKEKSMVAPRAGFTQRWKAGVAERKKRDQQRQAWRVFWIFSGVASGVLAGVFTFFLTRFSLAEWLEFSVEVFHQFGGMTSTVSGVVSAWMRLTPFPFHLFVALVFLISLLGLLVLWLAVLSRSLRSGEERV